MAHIDETKAGIIKTPPTPGLVQVEEGTSMVLRSAWGSTPYSRVSTPAEHQARIDSVRYDMPPEDRIYEGYEVKNEGWRLFIPGIVHDFVAIVSRVPRQENVAPMPVNVKNGQAVAFNIRFSVVVGEVKWRLFRIPLAEAERFPAYAEKVREARRKRQTHIFVTHPDEPFDKAQPYVTTDAAIIRAALRPENIWQEASTAIASALNEAAQELGIADVEPLAVNAWLNQGVTRRPGHLLPIRVQRDKNRQELMEQVVVMANQSLHRFGLVIFDVRLEGIELPEALRKAVEQVQSAEQADKAADHRASAAGKVLKAMGMEKLPANPGVMDRAAQAYLGSRVLKSLDAQSGVPSSDAPIVSVGDVMSGNAVGGPGGGSSKGAPGGKSGGGGAPKKKP